MPAALLPPDESARLAALHARQILDTAAEARVERLTRLAQRLFQVPIVLVSLGDTDRQGFTSCIGLDGDQTTRAVALCTHALLHPDAPVIIHDAHQDARLAQHPLVTGAPHIRFYAGHVLRSPDGQVLGTLCLLDHIPHPAFSSDDQQTLADLAMMVEHVLVVSTLQQAQAARAQAEAALRASEQRFTELARNVPGMVYQFVLHPDGTATFPFASVGAQEIFELDPAALMVDARLAIARIVPEHQASFQQSVADSAATLQLWEWQGRIRMPDGREKWIAARSRPQAQADGSVVWDGVLQECTTLKTVEAEQARFMALADAVPEFIAMVDLENRPLYMNPAGRTMIGLGPDEPVEAVSMTALHPERVYAQVAEGIAAALAQGRWTGETVLLTRAGQEIPVLQVILCHRDDEDQVTHFSTIARDLTAEQQAESRHRDLQEQIIQVQAQAIAELSTPLITLTADTVLMPLIGAVDTQRAQQILDTLLHGVTAQRARIAILDLTGVPLIDTQVAAALIQAAQAVRLLGAEVILTGIRPEIAQTLVTLGVDLRGVRILSALQQGIAYALVQRGGGGRPAEASPR